MTAPHEASAVPPQQPAAAGPLIVLHNARSLPVGRPCRVARTSSTGVTLLTELRETHIDDLWLDHDLGGDDTIWPVIRLLEDAHLVGRPFEVGMVHVHAARGGPAHRMGVSLRGAEYSVERCVDLEMWTW